MGLMMGPALAFRHYGEVFRSSQSAHLQRAGAFMTAGWDSYRERRLDRVMFRYADTVRELHAEIEDLRRQVEMLEHRLDNTAPQSHSPRNWNLLRWRSA